MIHGHKLQHINVAFVTSGITLLNELLDVGLRHLELEVRRQSVLQVGRIDRSSVLLVEEAEALSSLVILAVLLHPAIANEYLERLKVDTLASQNVHIVDTELFVGLLLRSITEAEILQDAVEVRQADVTEVLLVVVLESVNKICEDVARQLILLVDADVDFRQVHGLRGGY